MSDPRTVTAGAVLMALINEVGSTWALVGSGAMAHHSDPELLVLLGLRLRSFATASAVALTIGLPEAETTTRLEAAKLADWAQFRDGRITGWMLTATGRVEGERQLADELDTCDARPPVTDAYFRFMGINQHMLDVCTQWQLRLVDGEQIVNDHLDAIHDGAVVDQLIGLDRLMQPVVAELAAVLDRFSSYGPRLECALANVQAGEVDWFTKPTIDSYHTVWFELHENLLATLGIERGNEPDLNDGKAR
ncbi:MAG: transcriptional regulator [Actinomycetes bacterium]